MLNNIVYILDKVRFSMLRGLLLKFLLPIRSGIPLVGRNVKILRSWNLFFGKRCYLGDNSYIECYCGKKLVFGNRVTIREFAWIQCRSGFNEYGQGLSIGNRTYIGPYAVIGIGGEVLIGENCQIGARFTLSAESHTRNTETNDYVSGDVSRKGIKIGNNCWIGNNVTILDGVTVGDNVVVGAGSVVTRSLPSNCTAYGIPARVKENS